MDHTPPGKAFFSLRLRLRLRLLNKLKQMHVGRCRDFRQNFYDKQMWQSKQITKIVTFVISVSWWLLEPNQSKMLLLITRVQIIMCHAYGHWLDISLFITYLPVVKRQMNYRFWLCNYVFVLKFTARVWLGEKRHSYPMQLTYNRADKILLLLTMFILRLNFLHRADTVSALWFPHTSKTLF